MPKPYKLISARTHSPPTLKSSNTTASRTFACRIAASSVLYRLTKDGTKYLRPRSAGTSIAATRRHRAAREGVRRPEGDGATRRRRGTPGVAGAGRVHRPGRRTRPPAARRSPERLRRRPRSEGGHRRSLPADYRPRCRAAVRVRVRVAPGRRRREGRRMVERSPPRRRGRGAARRGFLHAGRNGEAAGRQRGRRPGGREAAGARRDRQRQGPHVPPCDGRGPRCCNGRRGAARRP